MSPTAPHGTVYQEENEEEELEASARLLGEPTGELVGQVLPWRPLIALTTAAVLATVAAMAMPGRPSSAAGIDSSDRSSSLIEEAEARGLLPEFVLIEEAEKPRKGSFLVIGDWGWDSAHHANIYSRKCQSEIADQMHAKALELGDVKFVINVGDSFYPHGVRNKSDSQWQKKWRNVYSKGLRSVPWYSVYGNHDMHHDPCTCSDDPQVCAQVNKDDLNWFHMPAPSFAKEHPELGVEVVALELNHYMGSSHAHYTCRLTPCPAKCLQLMEARAEEAFKLFFDRLDSSPAKNLLVFSHYPTDYFHSRPDFIAGLSDDSKHHIEYFGGHRHNVDQHSTKSTAPNNNWLVGGGGGYSCGGGGQGFVVGEIADDGTIRTYSVLVESGHCCH